MNPVSPEHRGVIAALITPCSKTGIPDPVAMKRFSGILIDRGCHGLFVVGSTGEQPLLDEDQRRELIAAAREGAGKEAKIYAGVSGCGAKQAIRYACNAEKDGADAAIVMAPFFLACSQQGLVEYIRQIADASPIPVGIYNHFRMPSQFENETLLQLAKHPNIIAVKDTDSDVNRSIGKLNALKEAPISFFQGREPFLYDSFSAGAEGCVSALANIAPEAHRQLYDAFQAGNPEEAKKYQKRIDSLGRIFQLDDTRTSFAGFSYSIRQVAKCRGWLDENYGMLPGFTGTDAYNQKLFDIASEAGLLNDDERIEANI
ncbi:MAG: dihydrodipicolinate synthase family protein [Bacteroidetes bacterium]|nr:dihydrodipicolinate synthase family protein [Bacteroidota bacterium]